MWLVHSEAETARLAARLATVLRPGDVVALLGELGAGKTRFVQYLAEACGVPRTAVTSPTFTLVHEYAGRILLRHCDVYRLRHPREFADVGVDELFAEDGVALVEWADRVEADLPRDHLRLEIVPVGPTERNITLTATGPRSRQVLQGLLTEASL
uniref:tRNA threonylcarbamoyladenosine biosynthesis protein TsaE n=1 Tax=Schlesneria paludicola TaxID=360056 RepID=A0A7C4QQF4_9PLAN